MVISFCEDGVGVVGGVVVGGWKVWCLCQIGRSDIMF